jgi:hypothetical protein
MNKEKKNLAASICSRLRNFAMEKKQFTEEILRSE